MSVVYYVPDDSGVLHVATMADRAKAKAVERSGKVSLCVLDETWPFSYLQVYCDAVIERDPEFVCDVMMGVGWRMSGSPVPVEARPLVIRPGTLVCGRSGLSPIKNSSKTEVENGTH